MKLFHYFSQIIGMDIKDAKSHSIGRLHDIVMSNFPEIYPRAGELIFKSPSGYAKVPWSDVTYIED